MKILGKLAVLGAVLAASVPFASATSFTGFLTVQDAPAGDLGSSDSTVFVLSSVFTGTSITGNPEPNTPTGSPNLSQYILNPTLYTFSTATFGPSGTKLYTGTSTTGDTATFFATSFTSLLQDVNGDYGLTAFGFFTDALGNQTPGFDNITFDSGTINTTADTANGAVSEILTATPAAAPEPSSLLLLGSGLVGAAGMMIRRKRIA